MKNLIKNLLVVISFAGIVACETLEPFDENRLDFDYVNSDPESAEGLLLQGYTGLVNQFTFSEAATDDAVNNQLNNGYKRIALGELNAQFNPASNWDNFLLYMCCKLMQVEEYQVSYLEFHILKNL